METVTQIRGDRRVNRNLLASEKETTYARFLQVMKFFEPNCVSIFSVNLPNKFHRESVYERARASDKVEMPEGFGKSENHA